MLQTTLGSAEGYARWRDVLRAARREARRCSASSGRYAHHFCAGIRYLLLDLHIGIDKPPARTSAIAVLVLGVRHHARRSAWRLW